MTKTKAKVDRKTAALIRLYMDQSLAVDMLPYSNQFEWIWEEYWKVEPITRRQMYLKLINLRKRGLLPRRTTRNINT